MAIQGPQSSLGDAGLSCNVKGIQALKKTHGLATNALPNFVQLEQGFYRREPVNVKFEKVLLDVLQHRVVELEESSSERPHCLPR